MCSTGKPLTVQQPRLFSDAVKPPSTDVKPIVTTVHPFPLRFLQLAIDTTAAMGFWPSSPTGTSLLLLALISLTGADSPTTAPCTVVSPQTSNFFDLRPLIRTAPRTPPATDWLARGHDYPSNFSLNICAPVLSDVSGAISIPEANVSQISAFYVTPQDDKIYSIGSVSTAPYFRGRKLILEYKDGSPCENKPLRKSTLMSLLCDRDLTKPVISFVGQANECAYFFEVRTAAACPAVRTQALGPVSVFGIIGLVAAVVYCVGGCMYQRTVMHARGWRQVPNYFVWAGMLAFVWGIITNTWDTLATKLPIPNSSSSHYARVGGRRNSMESENQLIDELDEDWGE